EERKAWVAEGEGETLGNEEQEPLHARTERRDSDRDRLPELREQAGLDQRGTGPADHERRQAVFGELVRARYELRIGAAGFEPIAVDQLVDQRYRGDQLVGRCDQGRRHHPAATEQLDRAVDRLVPAAAADDRPAQILRARVV